MERAVQDIWIDTDIVFNRVAEDVDDGLALMMALDCRHAHIHGISLNRRVDNGYAVTKQLLEHYARYDIPVYKGTDDIFASFGVETEAVTQLAEALDARPMRIVAIGAATNLANLLHLYPDAAKNIIDIVFCAGRQQGVSFYAGNSRHALPDANFDNDTASFERVLDSGIPIALSGFEASAETWITPQDIRRNGRPGDAWVAKRLQRWWWLWRATLRTPGFIPFDACTIGHVLYPELFDYHRDIPVAVNTRANDAPRWKPLAHKTYLEVSRSFDTTRRVDFAYAAKPAYKAVLMNHLLGANA